MNAIYLTNPVLVAGALCESFRKMSAEEFHKALTDVYTRGEKFARRDDIALSASLSEEDAMMYACHCRSFFDNLKKLKQDHEAGFSQALLARDLATVVAFWQVINCFETMHK